MKPLDIGSASSEEEDNHKLQKIEEADSGDEDD